MSAEHLPYHQAELAQALASPDDGWNRPVLRGTDRAILDIGCGIGQTFTAWQNQYRWGSAIYRPYWAHSAAVTGYEEGGIQWGAGAKKELGLQINPTPFCVGMDVDESAIRDGIARAPWATLLLQGAEHIPYPAETFDLVMSRVSLPYCNIPKVLREVHRTLKPGGKVWFTLHSREHAENCMRRGLYSLPRKLGVRLNGWLLHRFGFVIPVKGRYESWQDPRSFLALMARCGFEAEAEVRKSAAGDDEFRVTGVKR